MGFLPPNKERPNGEGFVSFSVLPRADLPDDSPIFGVLGGMVFLDEPFSWRVVIGGAATLVGVGIIIVRRPRMIAPEAQAER